MERGNPDSFQPRLPLTCPTPPPQNVSMSKSDQDDFIQMEVKGLMLDPISDAPIVVLRDVNGSRFLPIWIGVPEANAIALVLEDVKVPRPMTHDLFVATLHGLGVSVVQIEVHNLIKNTFYARLHLEVDGAPKLVDSRPSDAIAIALRAGAPILVSESVLKNARANPLLDNLSEDEKIKEILKNLDEEDLGDYTM